MAERKRRHSIFEALEQAPSRAACISVCRARFRCRAHPLDDAAVAPFYLDKAWHRRCHAEPSRIRGVDSARERLCNAVEHLAPEAPRDE